MSWKIDKKGQQYQRMGPDRDLYLVTYLGKGKWEARRNGFPLGEFDTEQEAKDRAISRAGDFRGWLS